MGAILQRPLVIFEMANNHMGDVEHGLRIIEACAKVAEPYREEFDFSVKFQLRDIPTYIHPYYKDRFDLKYVKRFTETALDPEDFRRLVKAVKETGFLAICTPFDETSVDRVVAEGFDFLKIASASTTDWPLLEKVAQTDLPLIISTAGSSFEDLDRVVSFFQHRNKTFALMHCVGEYPTPPDHLQLNQIELMRRRYPEVPIGFSTHEEPSNTEAVMLAVAKGARIFEKHVAVVTDKYPRNAYSATPEELAAWLAAARRAFAMAGVTEGRHQPSDKELSDLRRFRRGVYLKKAVKAGTLLKPEDWFCAWPNETGQLLANDMSKYLRLKAKRDLPALAPLKWDDVAASDIREKVYSIVKQINDLIREANIRVPGQAELEISHHYGLEKFDEYGLTMVTVVNREYCKKYLLLLPGKKHPEQYHKQKEETFMVVHGEIELVLDGERTVCKPGDVVTVKPGVRHAFSSATGAVIEELSSTHYINDSYYTDPAIMANKERKTFLTYWLGV